MSTVNETYIQIHGFIVQSMKIVLKKMLMEKRTVYEV